MEFDIGLSPSIFSSIYGEAEPRLTSGGRAAVNRLLGQSHEHQHLTSHLYIARAHRELVNSALGTSVGSGMRLLDYLYEQPIVNVRLVEKRLKSSFVTANKLVDQFVKLEILRETTGGQRNRRYSYVPYHTLFESSATAHQR